ncbi:2-acyl-glycerophospho-ethanolamine acyltransferase [Bordetella ansorpii]|uniref:2-acyl-glycerophospho-ethanolamine acyltransferase n=1 Tax=Bordetella ansorpii TaxID=288768 RepID=A0A157QA53_9BORD|nr:lysophospholipid acyltransferase family protein [Bordetella ansorpii]SAI42581.1 2-acyl-glycerophospho-ethanolamine acyltransferase [Bordetella ansorpii]
MIQRGRTYRVLRELLCGLVRFLVGAYPNGDMPPGHRQTLYFANHTSHLDTLVILAALKLRARSRVRPVAARDYWCKTESRRWVAEKILNVVFIDRQRSGGGDPLAPVRQALQEGASLIFFPEGTRGDQELPGAFKSGLFRLAQEFPSLNLAPVYLENLHRILPKGALLPLPLINKVHFGPVLARVGDETRDDFLARAHQAVSRLSPGH